VGIAAVRGHRLYSPSRRHSSAVEQLFRKSLALCAVLQAWRADTNGHTYQLFDSRGARPGSPLRPDSASSRPWTPEIVSRIGRQVHRMAPRQVTHQQDRPSSDREGLRRARRVAISCSPAREMALQLLILQVARSVELMILEDEQGGTPLRSEVEPQCRRRSVGSATPCDGRNEETQSSARSGGQLEGSAADRSRCLATRMARFPRSAIAGTMTDPHRRAKRASRRWRLP